MVASEPHTILLEGRDAYREDGQAADDSVTPGHLCEFTGVDTAGADDSKLLSTHSTDDEQANPVFALEYGKTGMGIDESYPSGSSVEYRVGLKGDEFYAFVAAGADLSAGSNATVAPGDLLVSAGDGSLRTGGTSGNAVAVSLESVDNSGAAAGEQARVKVQVI